MSYKCCTLDEVVDEYDDKTENLWDMDMELCPTKSIIETNCPSLVVSDVYANNQLIPIGAISKVTRWQAIFSGGGALHTSYNGSETFTGGMSYNVSFSCDTSGEYCSVKMLKYDHTTPGKVVTLYINKYVTSDTKPTDSVKIRVAFKLSSANSYITEDTYSIIYEGKYKCVWNTYYEFTTSEWIEC